MNNIFNKENYINNEIKMIKLKLDMILQYIKEQKQKRRFLLNDSQTEIYIKSLIKSYFPKKISKL